MCILMLGYKGLQNGEFETLHCTKCKKNCSLCLAVQDDLNMSFGVFVSLESYFYIPNSANGHVILWCRAR